MSAVFEDNNRVRYPSELVQMPRWYALRTRSRAEKRTNGLLKRSGVESCAAVVEVERRWSDRVRRVRAPLFPGYIFVRIRLHDLRSVLQWPGAVDLVRTEGVPVPLREPEMEAVMRLVRGVGETGQQPTDIDYMRRGEAVRVTGGPFEGMEGVLLEDRNGRYVAVRLEAIRQAKAVRIGRSMVVRAA